MFYVVRHGLTDYHEQNICQSQEHNPINETGFAQARDLADRIEKIKLDHFFSSDLLRAVQTADIVNEKLKMEIKYDSRLRERHTGIFAAKSKDNITMEVQVDAIDNAHKYGGETFEDVYKRCKSFYDEMRCKKINNALVMAHGGSIKMLLYIMTRNKWCKKNFDDFLASLKPIGFTEVFELDIYKS
jgi:probable phosphoglycerate mutase